MDAESIIGAGDLSIRNTDFTINFRKKQGFNAPAAIPIYVAVEVLRVGAPKRGGMRHFSV
jgi:hypothetical protein